MNKRNEIKDRLPERIPGFLKEMRALIIQTVILIIIMTSVGRSYRIPSGSMEDNLLIGDMVIVNKVIYGSKIPLVGYRLPAVSLPEPGDIVVFDYPGDRETAYVKRCVAVGGQTVEIKDKVLYIDGEPVPDPPGSKHNDGNTYPRPGPDRFSRDNWGPFTVPDDYFFMMGDNRDNSADSRFWGPVHRDLLIGEPLFIYWSWRPDNSAPEVSAAEPLSLARLTVYNLMNLSGRIRWERLLNPVD